MKKVKVLATTALFLFSGFYAKVSAQNIGNFQFPNPTRFETLEDVINAALSLLVPVFVVTFAAMILYGAWTWLTSQGDADKIGRARNIIIAAIIGFAIAVLAPSIAQIVMGFLGVQGLESN